MADWIELTLAEGIPRHFQVIWISDFGPCGLLENWAYAKSFVEIGGNPDNKIPVQESAGEIAAMIGLRGALGRE